MFLDIILLRPAPPRARRAPETRVLLRPLPTFRSTRRPFVLGLAPAALLGEYPDPLEPAHSKLLELVLVWPPMLAELVRKPPSELDPNAADLPLKPCRPPVTLFETTWHSAPLAAHNTTAAPASNVIIMPLANTLFFASVHIQIKTRRLITTW